MDMDIEIVGTVSRKLFAVDCRTYFYNDANVVVLVVDIVVNVEEDTWEKCMYLMACFDGSCS